MHAANKHTAANAILEPETATLVFMHLLPLCSSSSPLQKEF